MGFNQFSRPVQPVDQYLPISDEILARGAMETYNKAGQLGQKLSAYKSNLFGISTYGKDAEVLQDYENQFNQQVAELSKGDITSPQALSKFNSLISNFSNSPDILGIHERANKYNSDLKEFKDYQKAGKPISEWRQKSLKQANDYYNGNKYLSDQRFSGTIKVDPEINKMKLDIIKELKPEKYIEKYVNGLPVYKTGISEERIRTALRSMTESNGQIKDYFNDLFDNEHPEINWSDEGDAIIGQLQSTYSQGLNSPTTAQSASQNMQSLEKARTSSLYADLMKQQYKNQWLNNQFDADAKAFSAITDIESKAEDAQLHAVNAQVDLQKAKNLELYKQQADLYEYMDEASKSAFEKQDFANVNMQKAAVNKHSFELAKKQADAALLNPKVNDQNIIPGTGDTPETGTTYGDLKKGVVLDDKSSTDNQDVPETNLGSWAKLFSNKKDIVIPILKRNGISPEKIKILMDIMSNPANVSPDADNSITVDVGKGISVNPKGYLFTEEMDIPISKNILKQILNEVNPTGKYQEPNQGTGTNSSTVTSEVKYTTDEYNSAKQYAIDSLGYQNPSKEVVEKVIQQAKK